MAGPRIFVPGPGVNPNLIGSPAQYLSNIGRIANNRRTNETARERTANQKLFQDATLDLNTRKQDFTEAAPQRAEAERQAVLARDVDKFQTLQNYAEGAQYSGADRFTGFEDVLSKDPRYAQLDEAGKLAARNEFILKNPSALTDPTTFAQNLEAGLAQSGKFTGDEIRMAVAAEVKERYPTADSAIIKSLLAKPDFKISNTGTSGSGSGSTGSRSSSFGFVADPTNPTARGDVVDRIATTYGLADNPSTIPLLGNRIDIGNLDATKQDIHQAVGFLSQNEVNSPTAQEAAFAVAFNPDGTIKPEFDWRTPEGLAQLTAAGKQAQDTEERIFDKKGGGISRSGQAGGQVSPADIVNQATQYNSALLSRLTPQALTDSQVVSSFLDGLGAAPTNNARQGSTDQGGGPILTPEVTPAPVVDTPPARAVDPVSQAEDNAIFAHIAGQSQQAPAPQQQEPFDIGGTAPEEDFARRIFAGMQDAAFNSSPAGVAVNAVKEVAPAAKKLFESLTINSGILTPEAGREVVNNQLLNTQNEARAQEITKELNDLPSPAQRTLTQKAYARDLEQELKSLR